MSEETKNAEKWWVETRNGTVIHGPCIARDMALSVRQVIEEQEGRHDLWVRQNDDRDGWAVWDT